MKSPRGQIQDAVAGIEMVRRVYYFDEIGSTSDWARDLILRGGPRAEFQGTLAVAAQQTAGRGRNQREWSTPPGKALLFSVILRPPDAPELMPDAGNLVSMAVPGAVCAGIEAVAALESSVKYPNDVLVRGKKIAGILIERISSISGQWFVAGVGLNVNQQEHELPADARIPATSLLVETGMEHSIPRVLTQILTNLERLTQTHRFAETSALMNRLCSTIGREVSVKLNGETIEGTAMSISERGGLMIRQDSGILREIFSGDVQQLDCH